jgi:hypothetical protein
MVHRRQKSAHRTLGRGVVAVAASLLLAVGLTACGAGAQDDEAAAGIAAIATPTPVVTVEREDVSEVLPFEAITVDDPARDIGQDAVTVTGQNGSKVMTYEVTTTDGVETARTLIGESVVTAPVQQVTSIGTRQPYVAPAPAPAPAASGCDSNYAGACVPVASDVDCAGGSGNGPAYVQGPVTIVGSDVYDLDRDGDGIACDG